MNIFAKTISVLMFALPLVASQSALAADSAATPGLDKRQANQERRIQQGVDSGALNQREAARLERGQKMVEKMEVKAKADGSVTPQERARLHRAEDIQSKRIYRQKLDAQRRQ